MQIIARFFILIGFLFGATMVALGWKWDGRSVVIPDTPTEHFACVSYSPRLRSNDPQVLVPASVIAADLRLLSHVTGCIRTYTVAHQLDQVVPIAAQLGLKVLLGVWISGQETLNETEITQATTMANAYPNTVRALIVGNEVMLRNDVSAAKLAEYLYRVRQLTHVPLSAAEIWRFWLYHASLASSVDFITIHILPYWDDQPTSVEQSLASIDAIMAQCRARFAGKPILIGEIGWPSAGRPQRNAVPSLINQARFLRSFSNLATQRGWDYNLIEGFDQPWKRTNEGTVGGAWGLFTKDGVQKFPLRGAVSDRPDWQSDLRLSWILGGIGGLWLLWRGKPRSNGRGTVAALVAPLLGSLLVLQIAFIQQSALSVTDWGCGCLDVIVSVWLSGLLLRGLSTAAWPSLPALGRIVDEIAQRRPFSVARLTGWLHLAMLIGVTGAGLAAGFAFSFSHRDFLSALFLLPALTFLTFAGAQRFQTDRLPREEIWLGMLLLAVAGASILNERLLNPAAFQWAGVLLLFAIPLLGRALVWHRAHGRQGRAAPAP